jgi:isocitrate lyase
MLLIARTDSEAGKLISSTVDVADHDFILGTTIPDTKGLAEAISEAEASGKSGREVDQAEIDWTSRHKLCTFKEGTEITNSIVHVLNIVISC